MEKYEWQGKFSDLNNKYAEGDIPPSDYYKEATRLVKIAIYHGTIWKY